MFSQETQRLALLTTAHSWPLRGAWLPHSMVASGWSHFSQGHTRLPVECSSEQGNDTSYFRSSWDEMQHHFFHILLDKAVTSLPIFKGMGIGLCLLMGEGWGPRAHGRTVGQTVYMVGGGCLPSEISTCHPPSSHHTQNAATRPLLQSFPQASGTVLYVTCALVNGTSCYLSPVLWMVLAMPVSMVITSTAGK